MSAAFSVMGVPDVSPKLATASQLKQTRYEQVLRAYPDVAVHLSTLAKSVISVTSLDPDNYNVSQVRAALSVLFANFFLQNVKSVGTGRLPTMDETFLLLGSESLVKQPGNNNSGEYWICNSNLNDLTYDPTREFYNISLSESRGYAPALGFFQIHPILYETILMRMGIPNYKTLAKATYIALAYLPYVLQYGLISVRNAQMLKYLLPVKFIKDPKTDPSSFDRSNSISYKQVGISQVKKALLLAGYPNMIRKNTPISTPITNWNKKTIVEKIASGIRNINENFSWQGSPMTEAIKLLNGESDRKFIIDGSEYSNIVQAYFTGSGTKTIGEKILMIFSADDSSIKWQNDIRRMSGIDDSPQPLSVKIEF